MNNTSDVREAINIAKNKINVKENFHLSDYDWYNENKEHFKKSKWVSREERRNKKKPGRFKHFQFED